MEQLIATDTPEDLDNYLEEIRDKYPKNFSSYIKAILDSKGMSVADMQKLSGIERTYVYQIMNGRKHPGRDKIVAIAIACRMTLPECQRALEIAKEGILYAKSKRDSLMIYAVNKKMCISELQALLEKYGQQPLD